LVTRRPAESHIAHTTHRFHCIPRGRIHSTCLRSKHFLRETDAAVVAVVRARLALASQPVVTVKTLTQPCLAVTHSTVGALGDGVEVVVPHYSPHPGKVLGTGALRAVWSSPLGLTVQPSITFAVIIVGANASMVAFVRAKAGFSLVDLFITHNLSPVFFDVRWSRTGHSRGLTSGGYRGLRGRLPGWLGSRLHGGLASRHTTRLYRWLTGWLHTWLAGGQTTRL